MLYTTFRPGTVPSDAEGGETYDHSLNCRGCNGPTSEEVHGCVHHLCCRDSDVLLKPLSSRGRPETLTIEQLVARIVDRVAEKR